MRAWPAGARTQGLRSGMLEVCEHQSSFLIYAAVGGCCDWRLGGRISSYPAAFEVGSGAAGSSGERGWQPQLGWFDETPQLTFAGSRDSRSRSISPLSQQDQNEFVGEAAFSLHF